MRNESQERPANGSSTTSAVASPSPAASVEPGTPLRLGEKEVGRLASVAVSPAHGPIALALVRREAEPGATLAAGDGDVTAEVVELPFAARA